MMTPSTSTPSSANLSTVRTNGPTASRLISAPKSASIPRVDETPVPPSHDFLKWLSDSLKGLNSSVNCTSFLFIFVAHTTLTQPIIVEDITSMLLSFPVDPDPSTVEIISDLIYENSTTLDGRRFASEFVNKRKADAVSKRATAAAGKPASIADVVKSQPKPMQPEWGGFKVVNKKKKGGRS
jgi:PERQ amino acid-rich with GYF domain-containing protein